MKDQCLFCDKGFLKDGFENRIIKFKHSTTVLDTNQFYRGKVIVMFNRHEENLFSLKPEERKEFWEEVVKISEAVKKAIKADRMNYALLCNREHHLHWHVIPRYKDDPYFITTPWSNPAFEKQKHISESKMKSLKDLILKNLK